MIFFQNLTVSLTKITIATLTIFNNHFCK